ncbi:DNA polymerase IV [Pseudogracilibacillus sp. SO30301A]|uniref:DNA polymerase IV n=1 Tax=Pseudogracilibacillus sp. SO30301A TaxID=3098291 RepID=UPI003FA70D6C
MVKKAKVIFHVDMNSFYASVEMAYNPKLKGKPIAIAGNPEERKGIIVTSSYEARAKGIKTTMPLWEAKKLCPELIVIRPNFPRYRETSTKIFRMLANFTPLIEPVSIDEGYMDVTDHPTHPIKLAKSIQNELLSVLDIPCSIGIGPNKFLAKTASDMKKPLGITILRIRDLPEKLWPLKVDDMYGVGKKTAEKLHKINIQTIGDLAKADEYTLSHLLGINGERLIKRANGIDSRKVDPDAVNEFKSIGNSQTLPKDTTDDIEIEKLLIQLATRVEERLQRREMKGQTVQLMIRYNDRKTVTRSRKLTQYIDDMETIASTVIDLLKEHWTKEPVRLLGVTVQDLLENQYVVQQLDLFTYEDEVKKHHMNKTIESLKEKFGENTFKKLKSDKGENNKLLRTSFQKDFLDDYRK